MAEKSKGKSQKRTDIAKRFVALGKLDSGLPAGMRLKNVLVGLGIALLTTALLIQYEFQSIPQYKVGDIADRTIEAPRDFTVVDQKATQEKREAAIRSVPVVFTFDFQVIQQITSEIRMAFEDARQTIAAERTQLGIPADKSLPKDSVRPLERKIDAMLPRFSYDQTIAICMKYGFSEGLEDQLVQLLNHAMKWPGVVLNRAILIHYRDRGIVVHNSVTGETEELNDWMALRDVSQARDTLRQQEYELTQVTGDEKKELISFLERWIVPDTEFDEKATREAEQKALAEVNPVLIQVKQGKTIIRAGEEITEQSLSQLTALRSLRLQERWIDRIVGVFLIVLFLYFILWSYLQLHLVREKNPKDFFLLVLVLMGSLLINRLFLSLGETVAYSFRIPALQEPRNFFFFAPLALGAVLIMLLVGANLTIFFSIVQSAFIGLLTGELSVAVYCLAGSLTAIYTLRQYRDRSTLIRAGLWIGGVNLIVAFAFQLWSLSEGFVPVVFLVRSLAGIVSGLLSALISTLFLPALESIFGLTTDIRLLELSNLNSPILRRLALEAPGTYHHSITVGTLAESGAEAIGANTLLIRVGAYYHDIGKIKHPEYYVENQIYTSNKHETLSPSMSSLILASHVKDGLALADEIKLGPKVAALIPQHHGTRVMTYFYRKAKEAAADKNVEVSENDFRYPGPKPQGKEAAILMLADQVEAAARTLQEPTPGQIRGLINRVTQATIQDGQLDECDITMKDLSKVERAFERVLTGIYHHRIEYPGFNFNKPQVEEREAESQSVQ
jgi:putative nucleotidyltransferase with HDIG domain